jgi:urate oxidase
VIEMGPNRYGKSAIRLVKLIREGDRHTVRDLTVAVALEGDFETAHTEGDNASVVATDTMKNTVYAFAPEHLTGAIERFGHALAHHFVAFPQVSAATISIDEHRWVRIPTDDGPAPDAFLRSGDFTRTAEVRAAADGVTTTAGLRDLTVMKSTRSAFAGFPRDRFTTLPEVDDRIMATMVTATWRYGPADGRSGDPAGLDYDATFDAVGATLLEVFAEHHSPSVQASIWIMGRAILDAHPEIDEVRMILPNLHHWAVDLTPFGMDNRGDVFVATREPHGLIDATVRRGD